MTRPSIVDEFNELAERMAPELAERRTLVLAHPDLAKRLTLPPLRFSRPEVWSGFIPPLMVEGPFDKASARGLWIRNPSPQRVHLVSLTHEAYARHYGEAIGQEWLQEINDNAWTTDWSPHDAIRRATARYERTIPDWARNERD